MTDIAQTKIGAEAEAKLVFEDGKLKAKLSQDGAIGGGKVELYLKAEAVLDAIAEAIPGHFEDAAIAGAKLLLKAQA